MKQILITLFFLTATLAVNAQKVATYATGTQGAEDYESFGFWTGKEGNRSYITYNYGSDKKEAKVTFAGTGTFKGVPAIKIQFNNKLVLFAMINGDQLQIANAGGTYLKTFKWEYEGPVNGVGTHCNVCASDPAEAIDLVKKYF